MIRLEIGLEIRHGGVMRMYATADKTAVVVVASHRSVPRNPVLFKALVRSVLCDFVLSIFQYGPGNTFINR